MLKDLAIFCLSPIYDFFCDFCNFCEFFAFFLYFRGAFFCIFHVFNNEVFLCAFFFDFLCFFFMFLCTFFEFFASADRRSRYVRYRENIRDNQCGENYNIGNKQ